MAVIGGKWKAAILFYLIDKPLRYRDLRNNMPTVTERTLSLQLKKLESDGIINRTVYQSKPPQKVEYGLTALGKTLIPLLHSIANWGELALHENQNDA